MSENSHIFEKEIIASSENIKSMDEKWFEKISPPAFADTELFKWFRSSSKHRDEVKEEFFKAVNNNDESFFNTDKFNLDYPLITESEIDFNYQIKRLDDLEVKLLKEEKDPLVIEVYRQRIAEKKHEFGVLQAVREGNDEQFALECEAVYGTPQKEYFDMAFADMMENVSFAEQSESIQVRQIHKRFLEYFSKDYLSDMQKKPSYTINNLFDINDLAMIGQKTAEIVSGNIIQGMYDFSNVYSAEAIEKIFKQYISQQGLNEWDTNIDKNSKLFSVDQDKKIVNIAGKPKIEKHLTIENEDGTKQEIPTQKYLDWIGLNKLKMHEVGTHAVRGFYGFLSGIKLLRYGLAGYERGEEGVATFTQQMLTGAKKYEGLDGYIAAGLSKGLDGNAKRNFKELFLILRDYYNLLELKKYDFNNKDVFKNQKSILKETAKLARENAWTRCVRNCKGPKNLMNREGLIFTKDIVYWEGNINIWKLVNKVNDKCGINKTKLFIQTFYLGKWDPTNPEHYKIMTRIKTIKPEQKSILEDVYNQFFGNKK